MNRGDDSEYCFESGTGWARFGRGLICIGLTPERCDELDLPLMVEKNTSSHGTAFCVTVEARDGTTTGISAHDRAATVRALVDPATGPDGVRRPGHMFPLRAPRGGVLKRAGHTEAAVDLTRLAGLTPAGVLCEIMDDDGEMARLPRLQRFAREHDLGIITVADLIAYRMTTEKLVERVAGPMLPTAYGGELALFAMPLVPDTIALGLLREPRSVPFPFQAPFFFSPCCCACFERHPSLALRLYLGRVRPHASENLARPTTRELILERPPFSSASQQDPNVEKNQPHGPLELTLAPHDRRHRNKRFSDR